MCRSKLWGQRQQWRTLENKKGPNGRGWSIGHLGAMIPERLSGTAWPLFRQSGMRTNLSTDESVSIAPNCPKLVFPFHSLPNKRGLNFPPVTEKGFRKTLSLTKHCLAGSPTLAALYTRIRINLVVDNYPRIPHLPAATSLKAQVGVKSTTQSPSHVAE